MKHSPEVQQHRDEVYEKCIRKAEQQKDQCGNFRDARTLDRLILSLKSMRHSEHKENEQ